ncbi:uncharacterized protein SPPG_09327 [Spizellomyces punctatus DAOM BR117]|uniref:Uncharacterized protein n=1 Tax=Spizellomyces punctatus (strain DAOM BR117) TaxID=645134 RepID=A0A0L0HD58_SPIPD|nr:uncharacterized protein SPPG_09327 [Spizellomyces punctatus DAOM BR117]KNC98951.1 hypothetical protein SPPG_09327 [Spizellomyces punctatus DAOM BR117]|eukprot:XP_016606991.1 hypothetical protein SPPG_09327 [Spizellomyces punctatus DAOM BR117]
MHSQSLRANVSHVDPRAMRDATPTSGYEILVREIEELSGSLFAKDSECGQTCGHCERIVEIVEKMRSAKDKQNATFVDLLDRLDDTGVRIWNESLKIKISAKRMSAKILTQIAHSMVPCAMTSTGRISFIDVLVKCDRQPSPS